MSQGTSGEKALICIDFGTHNTVVAFKKPGSDDIEILESPGTQATLFPSRVFLVENEEESAWEYSANEPRNNSTVVHGLKHLVGWNKFEDLHSNVRGIWAHQDQAMFRTRPTGIHVKGTTGREVPAVDGLQTLMEYFINKLQNDEGLDSTNSTLAVTIPLTFGELQIVEYTKILSVLWPNEAPQFPFEPVAAWLAVAGTYQPTGSNDVVAVFDCGAGTVDLAVFNVQMVSDVTSLFGPRANFKMKHTWASNHAGNAYTRALQEWVIEKVFEGRANEFSVSGLTFEIIDNLKRRVCEKLTGSTGQVTIPIDLLPRAAHKQFVAKGYKHITREHIDDAFKHQHAILRTKLQKERSALARNHILPTHLVYVGGGTMTTGIRTMVEQVFPEARPLTAKMYSTVATGGVRYLEKSIEDRKRQAQLELEGSTAGLALRDNLTAAPRTRSRKTTTPVRFNASTTATTAASAVQSPTPGLLHQPSLLHQLAAAAELQSRAIVAHSTTQHATLTTAQPPGSEQATVAPIIPRLSTTTAQRPGPSPSKAGPSKPPAPKDGAGPSQGAGPSGSAAPVPAPKPSGTGRKRKRAGPLAAPYMDDSLLNRDIGFVFEDITDGQRYVRVVLPRNTSLPTPRMPASKELKTKDVDPIRGCMLLEVVEGDLQVGPNGEALLSDLPPGNYQVWNQKVPCKKDDVQFNVFMRVNKKRRLKVESGSAHARKMHMEEKPV